MSRSVRMDYEAIRERQARAQESLITPEPDRPGEYQQSTFADRMAARSLAAVEHESWRMKQG